MRVVIYDEESLEAITVVNLPGLTDLALRSRQHWRVAVPLAPNRDGEGVAAGVRTIDLRFEELSRVTLAFGEQLCWLCFTRAADLAMLLIPDWLPGQRPTIEQLEDENTRLTQLMLVSLTPS